MGRKTTSGSIRKIAFMGLLFATAMVLSFLESMLPVLPMLPPGVKLGLSNIVTMYALFTLGVGPGFTIAVLKSLFVFLIRGALASALSLAGGVTALCLMLLLGLLPGVRKNYLLLSIFGAVGHNVGQVLLAAVLLQNRYFLATLPLLVLSGVGMGVVTGLTLRAVMPYINRLKFNF